MRNIRQHGTLCVYKERDNSPGGFCGRGTGKHSRVCQRAPAEGGEAGDWGAETRQRRGGRHTIWSCSSLCRLTAPMSSRSSTIVLILTQRGSCTIPGTCPPGGVGDDYFIVKVKARGDSHDVEFAWMLTAPREGYANVRLEPVTPQ